MQIKLLCTLFFGATICLGAQNPSSDTKKQEVKKAMGKAILEILGLKTQPKPKKGLKEKVPQFLLDFYDKQAKESESKGDQEETSGNSEGDISVRTMANQCKRHTLYIDFSDLYGENNYIIAPTGFDAFYCSGECPRDLLNVNATTHAYFQNQIHLVNSTVPPPCCVPSTLKAISMLYLGKDDKIHKEDVEMSVEGCGCH